MCENFKRLEKLIFESGQNYLPADWAGNNDMSIQEELLDHILMYILKLDLHKGELISEDAWCVEAKRVIDDYGFWYAADIFDDLSCFYEFANLVADVEKEAYEKPEKMKKVSEIYTGYIEGENQPSTFYKKIYEFVDEELKDEECLED